MQDLIPERLLQAASNFDKEAERLLKPFEVSIETKPMPNLLFHYTDDAGLAGILESGKIRLSDIFCQNDPSEVRHGLAAASYAIKSKISHRRPEIELFVTSFDNFCNKGGIEGASHNFICCFSASDDDLGQWRAYANNGLGFALGFDTKKIEDAFGASNNFSNANYSSFPITYDDGKLAKVQAELAELLLPSLALSLEVANEFETWKQYMSLISAKYSFSALRAALLFKHEAYKNENEYRFLQLFTSERPVDGLKFVRRLSSIRGYRELDRRMLCADALTTIRIGPAANRQNAKLFVTDCLKAYHRGDLAIKIEYSNIPYRV